MLQIPLISHVQSWKFLFIKKYIYMSYDWGVIKLITLSRITIDMSSKKERNETKKTRRDELFTFVAWNGCKLALWNDDCVSWLTIKLPFTCYLILISVIKIARNATDNKNSFKSSFPKETEKKNWFQFDSSI